jgi:hypothetical protein
MSKLNTQKGAEAVVSDLIVPGAISILPNPGLLGEQPSDLCHGAAFDRAGTARRSPAPRIHEGPQ